MSAWNASTCWERMRSDDHMNIHGILSISALVRECPADTAECSKRYLASLISCLEHFRFPNSHEHFNVFQWPFFDTPGFYLSDGILHVTGRV